MPLSLDWQTRAWRAAEIPGSNGYGNARSVARVGAALACGGTLENIQLLSPETLEKAIEEQTYGDDLLYQSPIRWSLGVRLVCKEHSFPNPRTFYHPGAGGSGIFVDLDAKVSCAYVTNKMSPPPYTSATRLLEAFYSAL